MGLFKAKIDASKSDANKAKLRALFDAAVPGAPAYQVLYGYAMDISKMDFVVVRTRTYEYQSFVVGYRADDPTVVLLPTDPTLAPGGQPMVLRKADMHKAYKQKFGGSAFIVYPTSRNYLEFWTPDVNTDEKVTVYVDQAPEAAAFTQFFTETFSTK